MKKILGISAATIAIVGLVLLMRYHPSTQPQTGTTALTQTTPSSTTTPATNSTSTPASYKDGTYTGQSVDVGYGVVEVQAIVASGKISAINFLRLPSGGHSSEVSSFAGPQLQTEALQAQSSNVDIVSGATSTSEGFIQSLQNALSQAS